MTEEKTNRLEKVKNLLHYMNMNRLEKATGVPRQSLYDFRAGKRMLGADKFVRVESALREMTEELRAE